MRPRGRLVVTNDTQHYFTLISASTARAIDIMQRHERRMASCEGALIPPQTSLASTFPFLSLRFFFFFFWLPTWVLFVLVIIIVSGAVSLQPNETAPYRSFNFTIFFSLVWVFGMFY